MRVTQTMLSRQYTSRISSVLSAENYVNQQVGTGQRFFKASEDTSSAAKAYTLRRQDSETDDYIANTKAASSTLDSKSTCLTQINSQLDTVYSSLLGVINLSGSSSDTTSNDTVATQLRAAQESIVSSMNTKYGDKFLFGGSSTSDAPFALSDDGTLTYRGVDVSGETDYTWPTGTANAGTTQDSMELLDALSEDSSYVDLGFGLTLSNGEVVDGTAFDTSTPGINVLGYGTDEDGMSNNIVVLMGQIADMLESDDCDTTELSNYVNKFMDERLDVINSNTELGTDSTFLTFTQTKLETIKENIEDKISDVEEIDSEEAIINLNMVDYMYQAVLKTSSTILSTSLIDFMN